MENDSPVALPSETMLQAVEQIKLLCSQAKHRVRLKPCPA
jgi:hypothetical protein